MKKRSIVLVVVLALLMTVVGNRTPQETKALTELSWEEGQAITVYHTNDVHGNQGGGIGLAGVSALKKNTAASLLVDAGDATQGLALASLSKGEDVIELMNLAGYDAMAAGNHEFDYGQEQLKKNASLAEFPILSANVKKDGEPFLKGTYGDEKNNNGQYTVIEKAGAKIGIFGLTTQNTRTSSNPKGLTGITFEDEIETAKEMIDTLEAEQVDIMICLAHLGDIASSVVYTADDVAEALTGDYAGKLDAIIDGHSHTIENKEINGVKIAQTGNGFAKLGKLTFTYDSENDEVLVDSKLLSGEDFSDIDPDATVKNRIEEILTAQNETMGQRVADTKTTLWGGYINNVAESRLTETNLGNLITDSMIEAGGEIIRKGNVDEKYKNLPIVAVENGGGIRSTIFRGTITKKDIINVLPFGNLVSFKAVTPKVLYELLEHGVRGIAGQNAETGRLSGDAIGGFLQVGGMKFTYNPNNPQGERVLSVILDGEAESLDRQDESRQIILATNDYLIAGGDKCTMLEDLPPVAEGGALDLMLENTILNLTNQGKTPLELPIIENRIVIQSGYVAKDYTAHVWVKDEEGNVLPNQSVTYLVDGVKKGVGKTDDQGLLTLTVSDGPHAVSLEEGMEDAYICNYTGTGVVTDYTGDYPIDYPAITIKEQSSVTPTPTPTATPSPEKPEKKMCTVTMNTGVGNPVVSQVEYGQKVNPLKEKIQKRGYVLSGWFKGNEKYDFNSPVVSNIVLTAKWKKVTVSQGKIAKGKKKGKVISATAKKIKGASGYQFKVASNKKMTKNKKTVTAKNGKITIKKWKKKYGYIKVRAYKLDSANKRVYGKWSKVKKL